MESLGLDPEKFIHSLNKLRYPEANPKNLNNKMVINAFAKLFYNQGRRGGTWNDTRFLGVRIMKSPLDLWVYQEIFYKTRPDLIVETGTAFGGSAFYFATILDLIGKGKVVTVDTSRLKRPIHRRIKYLIGFSVDEFIVRAIKKEAKSAKSIIVILDSDHKKDYVLAELSIYSKLVSLEGYLVVEDTNVNGHPVWEGHGPGPHEAVEEFLAKNRDFVRDRSWEKYLFTHNPGGFLRRIK